MKSNLDDASATALLARQAALQDRDAGRLELTGYFPDAATAERCFRNVSQAAACWFTAANDVGDLIHVRSKGSGITNCEARRGSQHGPPKMT